MKVQKMTNKLATLWPPAMTERAAKCAFFISGDGRSYAYDLMNWIVIFVDTDGDAGNVTNQWVIDSLEAAIIEA